jgi:hypothetical protein
MGLHRSRRLPGNVDLTAEERRKRGSAATVGHVLQLDPGGLLKHFVGNVGGAVVAGRAERDLAGSLLGVGDQVRQRIVGRCAQHREHARIGQHPRDRDELIKLVQRPAVEQAIRFRQDHDRGERHQQRVAVGLRPRRRRIADRATGALPIVDHDRTPEDFLQRRRHRPRGQVGLPAGRERNDHRDVARGPNLRVRCGRDEPEDKQRRDHALQDIAVIHRHSPLGPFIEPDRMRCPVMSFSGDPL